MSAFLRRLLFSSRAPLALLAAYWLALLVVNHVPLPRMDYPVGNDKTAHQAAFAGLAFLLAWSFSVRWAWSLSLGGAVWLTAAAYGALDELLQLFVPGRTADPADWAADVLGAGCGVAAFMLFYAARDRWPRATRRRAME